MIKVELKKGFVGITADGKRVEIDSDALIYDEPGSPAEGHKVYRGDIEGVGDGYYWLADGNRHDSWQEGRPYFRIVAPYPSERPFVEGKMHYILDTRDGSIQTLQHLGYTRQGNYYAFALPNGIFLEFKHDGHSLSDAYRVLGPVEPEPAPIINDEGTYVFKYAPTGTEYIGHILRRPKSEWGWEGEVSTGKEGFILMTNDAGETNMDSWSVVRKAHRPEPAPQKKRGMTKKRWEEIKSVLPAEYSAGANARGFQNMLREVVEWIDDSFFMEPLAFDPDEPEYEPHDIVSMAEELKKRDDHTIQLGSDTRTLRGIHMDKVVLYCGGLGKFVEYGELPEWVWVSDGTPVARLKNDGTDKST